MTPQTETLPTAKRLDTLIEHADRALAQCKYFEAEQKALDALTKSHQIGDYERMSRSLLPLQEARRHKRDQAFEAGHVHVIRDELPGPKYLEPGCYLIEPPRVGLDGRLLREAADKKKVPIIIVVREPMTRAGLWPIVAVGPSTIRVRVQPPPEHVDKPKKKPSKGAKSPRRKKQDVAPITPTHQPGHDQRVPDPSWFLIANEQLGDAAIGSVDPKSPCRARVDALFDRLQAHPDHEKLHQVLHDACMQAHRLPVRRLRPPPPPPPVASDDD